MDFIKKIGKEVISNTTGINLGSSSSGPDETWYVTAVRAEGIKDKDRLTKSDPYLVVTLGGKSFRTRTVKNDLSPQWNETFTFKVSKGKSKDIHLKLKDDDYGIDDTIGTAVVSAADLPMYSGEEKIIQIAVKKSEEIHGMVYLRVKKFVEGEQSYSSHQSTSQSSYQNYPQSSQYQQDRPSYQNYQQQQQQPSYQNYQQAPPSYQSYPQQQYQQQAPYSQPPQYQQQQNYPPAGYSSSMAPQQSSYSTGYPQQQQQQQQRQSNQYPYQQYSQGSSQGGSSQGGYNQGGYNQGGYNQGYR